MKARVVVEHLCPCSAGPSEGRREFGGGDRGLGDGGGGGGGVEGGLREVGGFVGGHGGREIA